MIQEKFKNMYTTPAKCQEVIAYLKKWSNNLYHLHQTSQFLIWGFPNQLSTLVCWIDVHARLLILRKNSPLHSLILVCTFIDFDKALINKNAHEIYLTFRLSEHTDTFDFIQTIPNMLNSNYLDKSINPFQIQIS